MNGGYGPRSRIDGDSPTTNDELGREAYVSALTQVIESSDTPVVLAIHGAWGTGKTSLMMQIREVLRDDPSTRSVWFDPWRHQFDDNAALGLLHATADQLEVLERANVKELLTKIAFAVAEDLEVPFVGLRFGSIAKISREMAETDFNKRSEQIRIRDHFHKVLEEAGASDATRIVFFIDDLDRCQPNVALSLLESLKLYFDLPGCVFLLAVDREPLESAVSARYQELGLPTESYLDKIIQLPFVIPAIPSDQMVRFVQSRLPDELSPCAEILAIAASDEPRSAKRVSNALILNHGLAMLTDLGESYDPRILALLIVLQVKLPALFRRVRLEPTLLTKLIGSDGGPTSDELLDRYVGDRPRLKRAIRLVDVDPDFDVSPYLTLTALVRTDSGSVTKGAFGDVASPLRTDSSGAPTLASRRDVRRLVTRLLVEDLGVPESEIHAGAELAADLGLDDLDIIEVVMALEEELGQGQFPDESIDRMVTFDDLVSEALASGRP